MDDRVEEGLDLYCSVCEEGVTRKGLVIWISHERRLCEFFI